MGMPEVFKPTADFTGMKVKEDKRPLYVTSAVTQTVIIVDEKGTEAAAATYVYQGGGGGRTFINFTCDHPFYYQIVDKTLDLVLFAGTCAHPPPQSQKSRNPCLGSKC